MSPEGGAERRFGRTPWQAARASLILALLGIGAVGMIVRYLGRRNTPLGETFAATGISPWAVFGIGAAAVIALAIAGFVQSVRTAERFRITRNGLEVSGRLGTYLLAW